VPVAVRAARATKDLERALEAGVTSIRDAGGLGVLLGRAVREGDHPGPHCYGAGAILSTTGGHGDLHDLPLDWMHDLARARRDAAGLRRRRRGASPRSASSCGSART
jgi:imidazolonepropionase-like amidohydrolase